MKYVWELSEKLSKTKIKYFFLLKLSTFLKYIFFNDKQQY